MLYKLICLSTTSVMARAAFPLPATYCNGYFHETHMMNVVATTLNFILATPISVVHGHTDRQKSQCIDIIYISVEAGTDYMMFTTHVCLYRSASSPVSPNCISHQFKHHPLLGVSSTTV